MSPQEALEWLYARQLFGIKLGLENPLRLAAALGNPHHHLRFLHVAGTNGKGSVCAFAATLLQAAGLRVGLFTSPHLLRFNERIQLNRQPIPDHALAEGLTHLRHLTESLRIQATFFELTTALALWWFGRHSPHIIVWETGMGGRLDATNIVTPAVCVITSISFDHQQWLGHTLTQIAAEKAGIFKPGVPALSVPQHPEAAAALRHAAAATPCPLHFLTHPWQGPPLPLPGKHQLWNAAAALAACRHILPHLPPAKLQTLAHTALPATHWPARFQPLRPGWFLDGAHNPAAITALVETWQTLFPGTTTPILFAALRDKNPAELLTLLDPIASAYLFCNLTSPRATPAHELQTLRPGALTFPTAAHALNHAAATLPPGTHLLITGSLYLAAETLAWHHHQPPPTPSTQ